MQATRACLTNMNAAYWEKNRDTRGFGRAPDRCYASHEIGLLKPVHEIDAQVVADLKCDPNQIAFFDDAEGDVEGARAVGMLGYQVEGVPALLHMCGGNTPYPPHQHRPSPAPLCFAAAGGLCGTLGFIGTAPS